MCSVGNWRNVLGPGGRCSRRRHLDPGSVGFVAGAACQYYLIHASKAPQPGASEIDSLSASEFEQVTWQERAQGIRESLRDRVARYSRAKTRDERYGKWLLERGESDLGSAVLNCNAVLWFRCLARDERAYLTYADCCRKYLACQLCSVLRGAKLLKAYSGALLQRLAERPGLVPYLVTHTIVNGADLWERYKHLTSASRAQLKARRRVRGLRRSRREKWTEWAKADGGHFSLEAKRGRNSGLWHIHEHSIWLCTSLPDQEQLSDEWRHRTGDSFIVDVRPLRCAELLRARVRGPELLQAVVSDIKEVTKYNLKFSGLPFEDCFEAYGALRPGGRQVRLAGTFGSLRGLKEPDEVLDWDELLEQRDADRAFNWIDVGFQWCGEAEGYREFAAGSDREVAGDVDFVARRRVACGSGG